MLRKNSLQQSAFSPASSNRCIAEAVSKLPEGDDCSYEPKLDGYHCLAAKSTDRVVLWSRRGNLFTGRFPEIARACENLPLNTLIDEVIAIDQREQPSIGQLQAKGPRKCLEKWCGISQLTGTCYAFASLTVTPTIRTRR
jgi:ATP-dependent DNA ligase